MGMSVWILAVDTVFLGMDVRTLDLPDPGGGMLLRKRGLVFALISARRNSMILVIRAGVNSFTN